MNDQAQFERLINQIKMLKGSSSINKINKGYSNDQKFIVEKNNRLYLLKCFDLDELANKRAEYEAIQHLEFYKVNCSRGIEIDALPNEHLGYMLLTYTNGEEAADALHSYEASVQYEIGVDAGKELAKMHQWHAPDSIAPWYDRKLAKHEKYMEQYLKGEARLKGDEQFLSFIDHHLHLMRGRPNLFQHDDFHVGNLIVEQGKLAGVIDFNRFDWGDPIHDFLKAGMFSSEVSVPFTIGQIKGYHGNEEPDEHFWTLYSLYLAMTIVSSIVWILKVRPTELAIMQQKLYRVLEDHDSFNNVIPSWYLEGRTQ
ncbi:aminoglycoside phosphotransferase family protein [Paenibacillus sp. LHD-38]|uniref:aminoglycoside phosphotransferase family protein n=1 Tax=Paenibacillus sp. LHD-38 TaxID=3072143 RepID=UPI00280CFF6F|nr:aminoglycoside phosphotransferase family protein [Paenibacillus sp. LHD-38]MDQ8735320.1 aminoglycoside phosphotransferase family protein [Paenibacillus sp. LHD-38]